MHVRCTEEGRLTAETELQHFQNRLRSEDGALQIQCLKASVHVYQRDADALSQQIVLHVLFATLEIRALAPMTKSQLFQHRVRSKDWALQIQSWKPMRVDIKRMSS